MEELSRAAIWQENWAGEIPLQLTLASTEVTALAAPPALYVMGPRLGYLQTVAMQARAFFQHVLPPGDDTPWFECNRLALPWHVPLGVLYDLLAREHRRPWALTVHFRSFPTGRLLRWEGEASLRAAFFNSLKEAAYVCQGSAAGIMGMATSAQDELWAAVAAGDGSRVAAVSGALRLAPRARGNRRPTLPLRIYVQTADTGYIADLMEAVHFTSRPVEASSASGAPRTLREALAVILAGLLPDARAGEGAASFGANSSDASASAADAPEPGERGDARAGDGNGGGGSTLEPSSAEAAAGGAAAVDPVRGQPDPDRAVPGLSQGLHTGALRLSGRDASVVVGGVRPPLDTPLAWLHAALAHADHFLYVVVLLQA